MPNTLLVRNGFTHYPQKQETYRYFKADPDLPPRIIMLDGSGSITFDVLTWLNEQKVPLVKIDWTGNVAMVASPDEFRCQPRSRCMAGRNAIKPTQAHGILQRASSRRKSKAVSSHWRHPFGAPRLGKRQCSERMLTSLASPTIPRRP